jgi:capsular exopolysaccharide synthesis family protein
MADSSKKTILDVFRPDSPLGTEFLRLFYNIMRGSRPQDHKAFLVTSAQLGEGKSTVAAFLAITMATFKKSTLLVDCDLRRPAVHRLFDLYVEDGMTDLIDGKAAAGKILKDTALPELRVITAGRLAKDPTGYFENPGLGKIFSDLRERFEVVVIDCAPVMPVVDPLALAPFVNGVLLVVKAGETHRQIVKSACDEIGKSGTPVAGVILNNMKGTLPYYVDSRYQYEYYSSTNTKKPEA